MRIVLSNRTLDRAGTESVDRTRALPGEDLPAEVNAGKWRAALPEDCWPRRFPADGSVWRSDVFEVAAAWRAGRANARHLLAATLMWQANGSVAARRHALRTLADDPDGDRTERGLRGLRADRLGSADLRTAYLAFRTDCRMSWFDGDAVTTLLYFAGYRRGEPDMQPLIVNDEIAARIPESAGVTTPANRGSSLEWMRYLNWAAACAGEDIEPELVELDLSGGGLRYGASAATRLTKIPRQREGSIPRQPRTSVLLQGSDGMRANANVTTASNTHAAMPSNQ